MDDKCASQMQVKRLDPVKVQMKIAKKIQLPKAQRVTITVRNDDKGNPTIVVEPPVATLDETEQLVWNCPNAIVELRFSPARKPFGSLSFATGGTGRVFSGPLVPQQSPQSSYTYLALVTTKEGIIVSKELEVRVNRKSAAKP